MQLQDPLTVNLNGLGPDPAYWESKRGQYVTRELSLAEWHTVLDGIYTFPDFPPGEAAYMTCYLEPYGGALWRPPIGAARCVWRCSGLAVLRMRLRRACGPPSPCAPCCPPSCTRRRHGGRAL